MFSRLKEKNNELKRKVNSRSSTQQTERLKNKDSRSSLQQTDRLRNKDTRSSSQQTDRLKNKDLVKTLPKSTKIAFIKQEPIEIKDEPEIEEYNPRARPSKSSQVKISYKEQ